MKDYDKISLDDFMDYVSDRDPDQPEFSQAVHEVMEWVIPYVRENKDYHITGLLERLVEPEQVITFRVPWQDDKGHVHVNRGYRVQFNSCLGPFKGGLRFHPSVNLSILKFLGFEQVFKNSLTGLTLGGAKGGSDFNPKGKSDDEIMRFCQSFMSELHHYIGADTDIPAGDIGVGGKEIGYLYGQYKRLTGSFSGILTGKGLSYGGSLVRTQSTGYGTMYFADYMLKALDDSAEGKTVAISGSGNVAQYTCEKAIQMGAKVVTLSDSDGFIYDKDGIDEEKLAFVIDLKNERQGRIKEYAEKYDVPFNEGRPWSVACDIAAPCATQNELDDKDAKELAKNGTRIVVEGANMPCTDKAVRVFKEKGVAYAPGKASNAGGVAVSGLEMAQNSQRQSWSFEDVDKRLKEIMKSIHGICEKYGGEDNGAINYTKGANIGGFIRVAEAMKAQGVV